MNQFDITFDEQYQMIKLYDLLRDMDIELHDLQLSLIHI